MKNLKYLIGAASILIVSSFAATPASAAVSGTPHDLRALTTAPATAEICAFCHTPHNGNTTAPLWNRNAPATVSFTTYSSATLDAGTAGVAGQPAGVSAGCLSCHDGATAYDSNIVPMDTALTVPGTKMGAVAANLGGDLSNDHPVSIVYDAGSQGATEWVAAATVKATLPLYGGTNTVECGSCHNPHDNDQIAANASLFLRISNDSSALCTTCHVK